MTFIRRHVRLPGRPAAGDVLGRRSGLQRRRGVDTDKAYVEAPGWGGPNMWFNRVPEEKTAIIRLHFDLRAPSGISEEIARLQVLGASVLREGEELVVMQDPEGNEFCVE